jgi:ABC-type antimicrobial peptide transport system permease subunit
LLYNRILKDIFWKSKDTKWIIVMAAIIVAMISMISAVGESIEASFYDAIYGAIHPWAYKVLFEDRQSAEDFAGGLHDTCPNVVLSVITADVLHLRTKINDFDVQMCGSEGNHEMTYNFEVVEGDYPDEYDEIIIEDRYRELISPECHIGDGITLINRDHLGNIKEYDFIICGFVHVKDNMRNSMMALLTVDRAEDIFHDLDKEIGYFVNVNTSDKLLSDTISEELHKLFEDYIEKYGNREIATEFWKETVFLNHDLNEIAQVASYKIGSNDVKYFKYCGAFIAFISATLFFNLFRMTYPNMVRRMGMLRCIGLSRKQLMTALMLSMLLYLIFTSGLALGLYSILEAIFGQILMNGLLLGISYDIDMTWHFSPMIFVSALLFICFIISVVNLKSMIKIMRTSPVDAIKYQGDEKIRKINHELKGHSIIRSLGRRNAMRGKTRTIYTSFTLFMLALLICTVSSVALCTDVFDNAALRKYNLYDLEFYNDYDGVYISAEDVEEIRKFDSVAGIKCCRRSVDDLHADAEGKVYVMTRIYDDEMFMDVCRDNDIDPGEVSEQPLYLQALNGENEPIEEAVIYTDDGKEVSIPILASVTVDPYTDGLLGGNDSLTLIMNEAAAKELLGEYGYNTIYVVTSDKKDALETIKSYLEAIDVNLYYSDLKDVKSEILLQTKAEVYSYIYVAVCVGFMAIINILCNVSINISMRLREYGIMRAMGIDRKSIVKMIVTEVVSVTGIAVVAGVILSVPLTCRVMDNAGKVNKLNVTMVAVAVGAAIYAVNYLICYLKGNHEFSKNIVMLTRQE